MGLVRVCDLCEVRTAAQVLIPADLGTVIIGDWVPDTVMIDEGYGKTWMRIVDVCDACWPTNDPPQFPEESIARIVWYDEPIPELAPQYHYHAAQIETNADI